MTRNFSHWGAGLSLVILILSGCAPFKVKGQPFQTMEIPEGKSIVYLYRPYTMFGGAMKPPVNCRLPGEQVASATLRPGGYRGFVSEPGKVHCVATGIESDSEVTLQVAPGEASYVKEEIGMGFIAGRPHLYHVNKNEGAMEIQDCALQ